MIQLKILFIKLISTVLKVFWIIPLHKNTVLFMSFDGKQFSDSPKSIYEDILKQRKGYTLIWGFRDPQNIKEVKEVNYVKVFSFKFLYAFCTSKYIIVNDFFATYLPVRKSQVLINTWHGGGWFKKIGLTDNKISEYDKFFFDYQCRKHTYFVASSEYFVDTVLHPSFNYKGKILRTGMPRNAIFFQDNTVIRNTIRLKFSNYKDALLVLYAPTYRSYSIEDELEIDLKLLKSTLAQKFQKEVVILFRAHHLISKFPIDYSSIIDVTSYPDMQELLLACDVLVSDYSSCMWDAAIQEKLVIVYAPDAQRYIDDQGFFLDIRKWPFLIAFNNEDLSRQIQKYNKDKYLTYLKQLIIDSQSYESADAVKAISSLVLRDE